MTDDPTITPEPRYSVRKIITDKILKMPRPVETKPPQLRLRLRTKLVSARKST